MEGERKINGGRGREVEREALGRRWRENKYVPSGAWMFVEYL